MQKKRTKRKINWFVVGLVSLPLLVIGIYYWATNLINSAESYRSPLIKDPPALGQALGSPLTRKLVVVLIDALRYDTSTNVYVMPFLNGLRSQGASAVMHSQPPSFSAPGWATILTGAWPEINDGQLFNPPDEFSVRTFTQDDIFAAAQRQGLKTAVSGYVWFNGMLSNISITSSFYTPGEDNIADSEVTDAALPWLSGDYQLVLIHLDQVDFAGHYQGGPRNPNWDAAATRADSLLGEIVAQLDLSKETILVVSDHGQIDRGGHGGPEPITLVEPFILTGAGVLPGIYGDVNMVDVAPTMAALLGTNIPASSQGHILTNMLDLTSSQTSSIQSALKVQQSHIFSAYTKAIDSTTMVESGDVVSATQTAISQARLARLGSERIWRNMLAVLLAILPGYVLILRKDKKVLWLVAGAALFFLVFNLRYALINGLNYSLSSFDAGASFLIVYTGTTAVIATIPAWLVPMFGLHAFKTGPRKAAETTLAFIWLTIYFIAFPILLNFALNGFLVTWTVPEWNTLFLGLISMIQLLVVASLGLLLVGIGAGVGKLVMKRSSRIN
jgi:hypothetical protein